MVEKPGTSARVISSDSSRKIGSAAESLMPPPIPPPMRPRLTLPPPCTLVINWYFKPHRTTHPSTHRLTDLPATPLHQHCTFIPNVIDISHRAHTLCSTVTRDGESNQSRVTWRWVHPNPIHFTCHATMFEEDFERCFICQAPAQGLYCSQVCQQQDKGSASPTTKSNELAPVRLTAQLPASLSPAIRPTYVITPSPIFGRRRAASTSSSSVSDSPIQSPHTNPSSGDSPQKELFNLPPPAFPLGSSGPMKIPAAGLQSRVAGNGSANATPTTGSVDTLRFGRKSSGTNNSVTSPLALAPRCGCGRALGHRNRSLPGDELNVACLSLGTNSIADADVNVLRLISDPIHRSPPTPNLTCPPLPEDRSISHVLGSSLLLSRSRSDPHRPPSPRTACGTGSENVKARGGLHPRPVVDAALGAAPAGRPALPPVAPLRSTRSRSAAPSSSSGSRSERAPTDNRRGRSRERVERVEVTPDLGPQLGICHEEREVAPTRRNLSGDAGRPGRSRSRPQPDAGYTTTIRGRTAGIAT
ncbi:hypothetical protein CspeluHIS016_0204160 [Cutaneotrichosporon spelunceum]|uniref:Uncharacterized protein n=1 Tax=Cutaneotrichosporon spelunceum TaxID=1672016 RepID=A0AAD3TS09_9TREE|nr:hypothetical protein CspeluHIS016_0204160 [Cutaneotrichosporon spelunceum]